MTVRYKLYYWPIPFRGVFIQYTLAYARMEYHNATLDQVAAIRNSDVPDLPVPCMAPPVLHDNQTGHFLSQMPAIIVYLAQEHGLATGDAYLDCLALKVILDCNDVLSDITNANGSQMWEYDQWRSFRSERLPRWLEVFEETGRRYGLLADNGYLLGTEGASHADIAAAALFGTMARCLPDLESDIHDRAPAVYGLYRRIEGNQGIRAVIRRQQTESGDSYCGGQIEQSIRDMLALDKESGEP